MADGKHVWNGGTARLQDALAAHCALFAVKCGSAVEPDQVRGDGRRRHFIRHRAPLRVGKRAPFNLSARNIEDTAVTDGAHAPPGWRLILYSLSDDTVVRCHRYCHGE